jgi:hypothetical protein
LQQSHKELYLFSESHGKSYMEWRTSDLFREVRGGPLVTGDHLFLPPPFWAHQEKTCRDSSEVTEVQKPSGLDRSPSEEAGRY